MTSETEIPRLLRLLVLVISAPVLLSALAGAGLSVALPWFVEGQRTALALMGFEIVVALAGLLGVLLGLGKMSSAPAMALTCIGGTILLGSALGWQGAGRSLAGISLMPMLGLRTLAALALLAAAALIALRREPRSWKPAITGALLGLPVLLAAAAVLHPAGRRLLSESTAGGLLVPAAVLVVLLLGGLLAASVHLIMAAFDMAADDPSPPRRA